MKNLLHPAELAEMRNRANRLLRWINMDSAPQDEQSGKMMEVRNMRSAMEDILSLVNEVERLTQVIDDITRPTV